MTDNNQHEKWSANRRTVLKSVGIASATGLIGVPTFSGSALGIQQDECPDDTVLLATENNHPNVGDNQMDVNIYAIYPAVGVTSLIETLTVPVDGNQSDQSGPITDNFNGNAWDDETGRFYFSRYDRRGPFGANPLPSELYFTELDGSYTSAGTLAAASAGAAFYNGDYYYIGQRTDELHKVTFNSDGTIAEDTVQASLLGNGDVFGFGDITFDGSVIYASATRIGSGGNTVLFFKVNADGSSYTEIATGALYGAGGTQISFGKDGVLYGVNARQPYEVFSIDTQTGDTTFIDDLPVAFSDVSNGPLCDDCVPCEEGELLAKYEFACVKRNEDDECVAWDFVLEGDGDSNISYIPENYTSKEGEDYEPMSVTFGTDYCDLYALVKSGKELEVQSFEDISDSVTVETANDSKFAISFVAFYCNEEDAVDAAEAFPSSRGPNL